MTSVPKPLKFLRPHFSALVEIYNKMEDPSNKVNSSISISICFYGNIFPSFFFKKKIKGIPF